jgi:hypothetical protein
MASVSKWFSPAYEYAKSAANENGQALFSCEYVKAILERVSSAESLLTDVILENEETRCGLREHLVKRIRAHRSLFGSAQ